MELTLEQVTAMAPDGSSAAAGKKLTGRKHWAELGQSAEALWGQCQGSALYQVKVDFSNLGYHCSCPSRKFPCKHVLGLLMLHAESPHAAPTASPPDWVTAWLAKRQASAEKKAAKVDAVEKAPEKPVDEKARARRAAQRDQRVGDGLERLDLWMRDLVRNGLAGLETQPRSLWSDMAKRLVDAQAPGLASRVERLGAIPGSSRDWPRRLLGELGRLKLVLHAHQHLDDLDPAMQSDVRQIIGWTVNQEELLASGDSLRDEWLVYAQWVDEEERVRTQRSWAVGVESGRTALLLQFAPGAAPFSEQIVAGTRQTAVLGFYPGVACQRAKILTREGAPETIVGRVPGSPSIEHYLETVADALARQPLLPAFGCVLHDVTLLPGDVWHVRDREGKALPLVGKDYWKMMAVGGGHPLDLMGEWDGHRLRPLGMMAEGVYWSA